MKKVSALIVILACMLSANNAFCGWSGATTITMLLPQSTALNILVNYSSPLSTCNLNGSGEGTRFKLDPANPDYKTQAAALTAAFLAKKTIGFSFVDETSCAPRIVSFQVWP